jgi:phospholipid/cholesterol/gamma-HCH transport system substrate-binding protein
MKTTTSQKIKIGVFTFAGLLVVVLAVFLLGNKKSLFNSTFSVYGRFKNVNGLQVGNNVRFAGINVGVVNNIAIVTDSSVRVDLTLNNSVKKFVKLDSKMSIGSDGLMGDKLIVIGPGGVTSNQEAKDGEQLTTVNPLDVDRIISKLTGIADNAGNLIQNLSDITGKVNGGKGSLGRLLNDDKMAKDLDATVKQAKTTMANVHTTTSTLNEDLTAAQHNFLLKGYFNKKKKAQKAKKDSIDNAKKDQKDQKAQQDSVKKAKKSSKD